MGATQFKQVKSRQRSAVLCSSIDVILVTLGVVCYCSEKDHGGFLVESTPSNCLKPVSLFNQSICLGVCMCMCVQLVNKVCAERHLVVFPLFDMLIAATLHKNTHK